MFEKTKFFESVFPCGVSQHGTSVSPGNAVVRLFRRWRAPATTATCWWSVRQRVTESKAWVSWIFRYLKIKIWRRSFFSYYFPYGLTSFLWPHHFHPISPSLSPHGCHITKVFTPSSAGSWPVFTMARSSFGTIGSVHWSTNSRSTREVRFEEFASTCHNPCLFLVVMTTRSRSGTTSWGGVFSPCLAIWITSERLSSMTNILGSWVPPMIRPSASGIGNPEVVLQCSQATTITSCVPISIRKKTWWCLPHWIKRSGSGTPQVLGIRLWPLEWPQGPVVAPTMSLAHRMRWWNMSWKAMTVEWTGRLSIQLSLWSSLVRMIAWSSCGGWMIPRPGKWTPCEVISTMSPVSCSTPRRRGLGRIRRRWILWRCSEIMWVCNRIFTFTMPFAPSTTKNSWYPLVNCHITMERSTIFHGKTHYLPIYFYGHVQELIAIC